MTATLTIAEFIEQRVAEDETVAQAALGPKWSASGYREIRTEMDGDPSYYKIAGEPYVLEHWENGKRVDPGTSFNHIARHDPASTLRRCVAHRDIVTTYRAFAAAEKRPGDLPTKLSAAGAVAGLLIALRALVSIWSDHPDFDSAWSL